MEEKKKHKHKVLVQGPISPAFIADSISKHSTKTEIGAHAIFLGQVRKDNNVTAIDYSAYDEMAENIFYNIREDAFSKYPIVCMHIYHSVGLVKTGEISLFVFVSCQHREKSFEALQYIVEEIKAKAPVWKKEISSDGEQHWVGSKT